MGDEGEAADQGRRVPAGLVGAVVLAGLLAVFVAQNRQDTRISFLVFEVTAPLWLVLLGAIAVALVLGAFGSARRRRRRR